MAFIDTHIMDRLPVTRFDSYEGFKSLAVASASLTIILAGLMIIDPRMLGTEMTWLKPFKFAVSFAVLFGTLALFTRQLSQGHRYGLIATGSVAASGAAFLFEMAYIIGQAARLEHSHFNDSTPFNEAMYGLMGLGASMLMASIFAVGALVLLDRSASIGRATRLSIVLGAVITAVLTTWIGGELAGNGRFIGTPSADAAVIPFLGWSMEVGDLRPAHFLSLHALQFLPLFGWYIDRRGFDVRLVWVTGGLYGLLTVVVFFQALSGAPLISA